jgi:spermidine synthase
MKRGRPAIFAALLGTLSIGSQIVLIRTFMTVFYGNELCVGLVLASWMMWVGMGSFLTLYLFHRITARRIQSLFGIATVATWVAALSVKFVRLVLDIPYGEYISLFQLALFAGLLLAIPAFCYGVLFAMISRLISGDGEHAGDPSATVYIWEAVGSVLGSVILSLLLFQFFNHFVAYIGFGLSLLFMLYCVHPTRQWLMFLGLFSLLVLLSWLGNAEHRVEQLYWSSLGGEMRVIEKRHSRLGELVVVDWGDEPVLYENGRMRTAIPDPIHTESMAALLMSHHSRPGSVLLFGGGLGGLAPELARYPLHRVDYVEINRTAFQLVMDTLSDSLRQLWNRSALHIHHQDGRAYLKQNDSRQWDFVIIDVGHPMSATENRYYTADFFQDIKSHMSSQGVLAIAHFPAAENIWGRELKWLNASLYNTLSSVFDQVRLIPGESGTYFATDSPEALVTSDAESLSRRYREFEIKPVYFHPKMFSIRILPERIASLTADLETTDAQINRDFSPISYFFDFLLWNKLVHGVDSILFDVVTARHTLWWGLLAGMVTITSLMVVFRSRSSWVRVGILFLAGGLGFVGMAFDIMLLLAFETLFGYLYTWIGVALALFMFGMATASWLVNRILSRLRIWHWLALLVFLLLVMAIAHYPLLKRLSHSPPMGLYLALLFGIGALLGGSFPLLCRLYGEHRRVPQLGGIYAFDLFGGAFGALWVSSFFIPLWGFRDTGWFLAAICLSGLVLIITVFRSVSPLKR